MIFANLAARIKSSIIDPFPIFWRFFYQIGPPPIQQFTGVEGIGFLVWALGLFLLLRGLRKYAEQAVLRADKLERRAEKDADILKAQEPNWLNLEILANKGSLSSAQIITIHQQIDKLSYRPEEEKHWYALPLGMILIGLFIAVTSAILAAFITKWLGLTH